MRSIFRAAGILAALTGSVASVAQAGPPTVVGTSNWAWNGGTWCGGNAFTTCASVSATATYFSDGTTRVSMTVTNNSGSSGTYAGTIFTAVGLGNMPAGSQYVGGSLAVTDGNGNPVSGWGLANNDGTTQGLNGVGISGDVTGTASQGIKPGLPSGQTWTFTFDLTGLSGVTDLSGAQFAIHGQGGPNGCSTKLVITDGVANTLDPGSTIGCEPTTVVPEPVTMSLLATGLAGMGGFGVLRRRRQRTQG